MTATPDDLAVQFGRQRHDLDDLPRGFDPDVAVLRVDNARLRADLDRARGLLREVLDGPPLSWGDHEDLLRRIQDHLGGRA